MLNFIRKRLSYTERQISVGGVELSAIIADSFLKRMIGLMYRETLEEGKCMLFTFPSESMLGIWMKSMKFPIDVIWLDSDLKIVSIMESLPPCDKIFCKTYYPSSKSMYVIEFNSGFVKKNNISKQTKIELEKNI